MAKETQIGSRLGHASIRRQIESLLECLSACFESSPEKRLIAAVLEDGVATLLQNAHADDRRGRRLRAETEAWITADDFDWPFSFVNVCQGLGLEASGVRSWVLRCRRELPDPRRRLELWKPGASSGSGSTSTAVAATRNSVVRWSLAGHGSSDQHRGANRGDRAHRATFGNVSKIEQFVLTSRSVER